MGSQFSDFFEKDLSFHIFKVDNTRLSELKFSEHEKSELKFNSDIDNDIVFTNKRIIFFKYDNARREKLTEALTLPYHSIVRWSTVTNNILSIINKTMLSITIYTEKNTYNFSTVDISLIEEIEACLVKHVL